jgi:hypothetical protein
MTADERWAALVETILAHGEATFGSEAGPQRAFGSTSLKTNGKIFAMLVKPSVLAIHRHAAVWRPYARTGAPSEPWRRMGAA